MAKGTIRVVLFLMIAFFVVSLCEARGRGGGGRARGGRYRYRGGAGGSSSGGSANAGMIVGIIFGVIGGIIVLVVIVVLCRAFVCNGSSGGSAKYSSSGGVVLANTATTSHRPPVTTVTPSVYDHSYKSSEAHEDTHNGLMPPSYDSAVSYGEDSLPYSSDPKRGLPESSYPGYPPEMPYAPNPPEMSYPPNPSGPPYVSSPAPNYGLSAEGRSGPSYSLTEPSAHRNY